MVVKTLSKKDTIVRIPQSAIKKGVAIIDLKEYQKLREKAIPTYYLFGKKAEQLDRLVKEGLKEYKEGKTRRINSLADLR